MARPRSGWVPIVEFPASSAYRGLFPERHLQYGARADRSRCAQGSRKRRNADDGTAQVRRRRWLRGSVAELRTDEHHGKSHFILPST